MANDPRASNDPLERLRALNVEDLAKLPKSEQLRLAAEANSALFRVRKEQQQQAQAQSWSAPTYSYRGAGYARGRGTYRGRGYRHSPYHHPLHRNPSIRVAPKEANSPVSATLSGGESTPAAATPVQGSNPPPATTKSPKDLVVLNGMPFWKSGDGTTLTRVQSDTDNTTNTDTPETVELGDDQYVRGADGNLHRSGTVTKTYHGAHAGKLCRDYTSMGRCYRGNTCHFIHDDEKKAICKDYLYKGICNQRCSLSHEPSAHNTPPCNFFIRGLCTNDSCRYAHVKVSKDAPVCYQFGELGWCDKGADCPDLHVYECPSFSNTGACPNQRCKLPHVAVAKRGTRRVSASGEAGGTSAGGKQIDCGGELEVDGLNRAGDQEMGDVMESDDTNQEASDQHDDEHDLSDQDDYVPLGVDG